MKLFISWSGGDTQAVAEQLRRTIQLVLVGEVDVFVSSRDILRGERGMNVIASALDGSDYGIVLVSSANQRSSWLNYEAGALARTLESTRVAPILLDMQASDLVGPLSQFQASRFEKLELETLLIEIGQATRPSMPTDSITHLFEAAWPELEKSWVPDTSGSSYASSRTSDDMLRELVDRMRSLGRRLDESSTTQNLDDPHHLHFARGIAAAWASPGAVVGADVADGNVRVLLRAGQTRRDTADVIQHQLRKFIPEARVALVFETDENSELDVLLRTRHGGEILDVEKIAGAKAGDPTPPLE